MKQITLVVLAIVPFGVLVIRYSGGRTVKSAGENRTTTSRDGTTIAFTKRDSGPPLIIVDGAFCYRENGPPTKLASLLAQHFPCSLMIVEAEERAVTQRPMQS
jgi:hypothetical protein